MDARMVILPLWYHSFSATVGARLPAKPNILKSQYLCEGKGALVLCVP